ncbi:lysoplasmalogenase-like [Trichosurus vulpecula]|uniref:lysoplasmalogenase-like n=1 Tax=Trichosurus vulpecula TaxID=9337 RepID=UPI00186B147A|nr:lysoplasmalogenase-like [Trichosurus vulpecula]
MEAGGRESKRRHTPELLFVWRLVPFFASCALYFLVWLPSEEPSWTSALAKCLPILCLAIFVRNTAPAGPYGQFIWLGLLCSILGDIVVTWPHRFLFGLSAFALARLLYLRALGWHPIRETFLESVAVVFLLYFGLLHSHLPSYLILPVAVYEAILALMLWRALVRGRFAALGGLLSSTSDAIQAWHTFVRPLPSARLIIRGTYYASQALLALSTMEGMAPQADSSTSAPPEESRQ